jgi:hypothetical protein
MVWLTNVSSMSDHQLLTWKILCPRTLFTKLRTGTSMSPVYRANFISSGSQLNYEQLKTVLDDIRQVALASFISLKVASPSNLYP